LSSLSLASGLVGQNLTSFAVMGRSVSEAQEQSSDSYVRVEEECPDLLMASLEGVYRDRSASSRMPHTSLPLCFTHTPEVGTALAV